MKKMLKSMVLAFACMVLFTAGPVKGPDTVKAASTSSVVNSKLDKPQNFRITRYLNLGFTFKWSKVDKATGYIIERKSTRSNNQFIRVATTKKLTYSDDELAENSYYTYRIRAYYESKSGKITYSKYSQQVKVRCQKVQIEKVHTRYFQAKVKTATTVTLKATGKKLKLPVGSTMVVYTSSPRLGKLECMLPSGREAYVNGKDLKWINMAYTTRFYTKDQKELFVNNNGYSSSTGYLVWINQYTLTVTVFRGSKGHWTQVRSMIAVMGWYGQTPLGIRRICKKVPYLYGSYGVYFTYNSHTGKGNAFHCRVDSNTRAAKSGGCVRLGPNDLYYMYSVVPMGTTVVCY